MQGILAIYTKLIKFTHDDKHTIVCSYLGIEEQPSMLSHMLLHHYGITCSTQDLPSDTTATVTLRLWAAC